MAASALRKAPRKIQTTGLLKTLMTLLHARSSALPSDRVIAGLEHGDIDEKTQPVPIIEDSKEIQDNWDSEVNCCHCFRSRATVTPDHQNRLVRVRDKADEIGDMGRLAGQSIE